MNTNHNRLFPVLLVLSLAAALTSCEIHLENPFEKDLSSREFLIRAGEHYSTPRLMETFDGERLAFRATFDESAKYDLGDPALQTNKNKLMGFSDCSSEHHENSARFGWQWFNNRLEIYAYCYSGGQRLEQFVGSVELDKENLYEIARTPDQYVFFLNGEKKASIARENVCSGGANYMLYPYFGGSVPAPHDVRIDIEIVK